MVEKGLVDHGWTYINIDDGWQGQRGGKYNAIQPNTKFPDMKGLADEIHALGLKIGIYSTPWIGTYAAHVGSYSDRADGVNEWIKRGIATSITVIRSRAAIIGKTAWRCISTVNIRS